MSGNLRLGQMRRCKPRLPPMYSVNLRQRLYLRQQLRHRLRARRLGKRKMNYAACSFASGAAARILRRIGFAGIAALLGALQQGRQMRRLKPLPHGSNLRLQLLCRHLNRRNLRLLSMRCHRCRRKPRLPLRQYLRRRMRARRGRKRKVRRRGMCGRKFRWRKPSYAAFWRGFGARLRRSLSGL